MERGKFITLEGGEGCGKSTQVKKLVAALIQRGHKAIATREVGGSPSAEEIRDFWLQKPENFWDPLSELCLIMAARREHLTKTVWPALEAGTWVVSDRFTDSTRAYQGIMHNVGLELVDSLYEKIAGTFKPDMTLLLDVSVDTGFQRVAARRGMDDRYQRQSKDYHEKLRQTYLDLAATDPQRFRIIDAEQSSEAVTTAILAAVGRGLSA